VPFAPGTFGTLAAIPFYWLMSELPLGWYLGLVAVPFSWEAALWGFVVFRVFDVFKPWPIRWADRRVAGGFGIMIDDILAAVYAWSTMHLWFWLH